MSGDVSMAGKLAVEGADEKDSPRDKKNLEVVPKERIRRQSHLVKLPSENSEKSSGGDKKLGKAISFRTKALFTGEFTVHDRLIRRVPKSLCCLTNKSKLRRKMVWLVEWVWFDNIIMFSIVLNSILLAIYDFSE